MQFVIRNHNKIKIIKIRANKWLDFFHLRKKYHAMNTMLILQ